MILVGYPTPFGKWLTALHAFVAPETVMQEAYKKVVSPTYPDFILIDLDV